MKIDPQDFWAVPPSIEDGLIVADNGGGGLSRRLRADVGPPVRGRFIPDNATHEQVYAEVARLLNLLEPRVNAPSVKGSASADSFPVEYEACEDATAVLWSAGDVEGLVEWFQTAAQNHVEDAAHDWDSMERDHAADQDADARMRTKKADDAE